jgi:type IV secretory pathway VirB3-like protein
MFGNNLDRIYAIKCLLSVNPLMFLIVCSSVLIIIIAVMIKVIEGPVYAVRQISVDTKNDMRYFENTVWYLFATMTTGNDY